MSKNEIRFEIIQKRDAIDPVEAERSSQIITKKIMALPEYENAEDVFLYASFRSEVATRELFLRTVEKKGHVYLPKVMSRTRMIFVRVTSVDEVQKGFRGIFEPVGTEALDVVPGLIVVPLVAFDKNGTRLGYGGGFYDRTLPLYRGKSFICGADFSCQYHGDIPCDDTDIRMDAIITEKETIRIS